MIMFNYILFIGLIVLSINKGISSDNYTNEYIDQYINKNCTSVYQVIDFVKKVHKNAGIDKAVYAAQNIPDYVEAGDNVTDDIKRLEKIDSKQFNNIIEKMQFSAFNSSEASYSVK